jgi:hypothetical protein
MKKLFTILKFGLFLSILLMAAVPAQAKPVETEFTGVSSLVGLVDPGVETHPNDHVHVRGLTLFYLDDLSDPRVSGINTIVVNYNMRPAPAPAFLTGPMWGTLHVENQGGSWDGTWTGKRDKNGFARLNAVAHGHGGYEGLKATYVLIRKSPDPNGPFEVTGAIR